MTEPKQFFNQSQPQTLQIGVMLLYIDAVFLALGGGFASPLGLALIIAMGASGYGIANEKKWGYQVGVGAAVINLLLPLYIWGVGGVLGSFSLVLSLMFDVALVALLLHPHSREYQKIWFK